VIRTSCCYSQMAASEEGDFMFEKTVPRMREPRYGRQNFWNVIKTVNYLA